MLAGLARFIVYILAVLRARPASIIYFMINRHAFRYGSQYRWYVRPLRFNLGYAPPPPTHPILSSIFSALPMGKASSHRCQCAGVYGAPTRPPACPLAWLLRSCPCPAPPPLSVPAGGRASRSFLGRRPSAFVAGTGRAGWSAVCGAQPHAKRNNPPTPPFLVARCIVKGKPFGVFRSALWRGRSSLAPLPFRAFLPLRLRLWVKKRTPLCG